jgi:hypothetical protein
MIMIITQTNVDLGPLLKSAYDNECDECFDDDIVDEHVADDDDIADEHVADDDDIAVDNVADNNAASSRSHQPIKWPRPWPKEKMRRALHSRKNNKLKKKKARPSLPHIRASQSAKYATPKSINADFSIRSIDLANGAFIGKRRDRGRGVWTLQELLDLGYKVIEWDGMCAPFFLVFIL